MFLNTVCATITALLENDAETCKVPKQGPHLSDCDITLGYMSS
jgi:hypothetical protein